MKSSIAGYFINFNKCILFQSRLLRLLFFLFRRSYGGFYCQYHYVGGL